VIVSDLLQDKPPTPPTEPSSDASPKDDLHVKQDTKVEHGSSRSRSSLEELEEESDETSILSRDPDRVVKSRGALRT